MHTYSIMLYDKTMALEKIKTLAHEKILHMYMYLCFGPSCFLVSYSRQKVGILLAFTLNPLSADNFRIKHGVQRVILI